RRAAAAQFGLEIAGELAGRLDDQRPKILLEEVARATRVAVLDAGGGVADRLPLGRSNDLLAAVGDDLAVGARGELGARALEGAERLALPVVGPARDLVERDRRHMDLVLHGAAAVTGTRRQEAGGSEQHATSQDAPSHADVRPPLRTYSVRPESAGQNMLAATHIARARISSQMEPRKRADRIGDDRVGAVPSE